MLHKDFPHPSPAWATRWNALSRKHQPTVHCLFKIYSDILKQNENGRHVIYPWIRIKTHKSLKIGFSDQFALGITFARKRNYHESKSFGLIWYLTMSNKFVQHKLTETYVTSLAWGETLPTVSQMLFSIKRSEFQTSLKTLISRLYDWKRGKRKLWLHRCMY